MSRATRAELSRSALQHNLSVLQQAAPSAAVMAVIKANGYGHGMVDCARVLDTGVQHWAVTTLEEAQVLRDAGLRQPITLLGGFDSVSEVEAAAALNLWLVLHHPSQLEILRAANVSDLSLWLKVDTGMHRLGIDLGAAASLASEIQQLAQVDAVHWMTHLACADAPGDAATQAQLDAFATLPNVGGLRSAANSAAVLAWPQAHQDVIRPGVSLYGMNPFVSNASQAAAQLRPVMTLKSALMSVRHLQPGDAVGYGGTWTAPEAMLMGVVACGYGDGYPREVPNGTQVLLNGKPVTVIGRVSMDMLCVDLRTQVHAQIGDEVVLWGEGWPLEALAASIGTIPYTLLTGVTARVPRVWVG
jgi:alanine racemase